MRRYVAMYALFVTACSSGGGGGVLADGGVSESGGDSSNTQPLPTSAELCVYACPASCPAKPPATDCRTNCNANFPTSLSRLRPEYVRALYACLKTTPCDQRENCTAQASTEVSTTPAAESACVTIGEAQTRCGVAVDKAACLLDMRKFNDTYLAAVKGCFMKECTEVNACLDAL